MNIQSGPDQNHQKQDGRLFLGLVLLLFACVLYVLWPRSTSQDLPLFSDAAFFQEDTVGQHPPLLSIDFSEAAWQQLTQKRAAALKQGLLITNEADWVPAEIQVNGTTLPAKIRLKGDWLDHLQGNKWSFRVKLKNGYSWRGMTVFSLHTPAARYHVHEWLLHQVWRSADILSPRYDFTQLKVNGEAWGMYAYEEHFVKQLPEQQQRREGPLLKWDEGGYWLGIARQLAHHGYQKNGATLSAMDPNRAPVGVFEANGWLETPERQQVLQRAINHLQALDQAPIDALPYLDQDRFAQYFAIADAFNAYHGITWHNQRLYYNPVTDQLEPVGFDGYGGPPPRQYGVIGQGAGSSSVLADQKLGVLWQDQAFVKAYLQYLQHFTSDAFWTQLDLDIGDAFNKRKRWLETEFSEYSGSIQMLAENNLYLHSLIEPFTDHSLIARLETRPDTSWLHLQNLHHFPIEVIGWGWSTETKPQTLKEPFCLPGLPQRDLQSRLQRDGGINDWNSVRFREQIALNNQQPPTTTSLPLRERPRFVYYRLLGGQTVYHTALSPHIATFPKTPVNVHLLPEDLTDIRIIGSEIYFPTDSIYLDQALNIPAGYTVHFPAGLHLILGAEAFLSSKSPIIASGNSSAPIMISGTIGSGGIAILDASQTSQFSEVIFDQLGAPQSQGWSLTGAVTTYQTAATFYRCRWQNNTCEDALNAFRTDLKLTDCYFGQTAFDAFDGDFCKATVTNCQFEDIGNDAIDFSGSIATLENIRIDGVGDKGVSVGEASDVTFLSGQISQAKLGMASKDLSTLRVQSVTLKNCRLGFAAYQKKAEYGPAVLLVEQYTAERVRQVSQEGTASQVQIEE